MITIETMTEAMQATSDSLKVSPAGDITRFAAMEVTAALLAYCDTLRESYMADRETLRLWICRIQRHHNITDNRS